MDGKESFVVRNGRGEVGPFQRKKSIPLEDAAVGRWV